MCDAAVCGPYQGVQGLEVEGAECPQTHPFAYYHGAYCCEINLEKDYAPQGEQCDGGEIEIDSLCCSNDRYVKCPGNVCANAHIIEEIAEKSRTTTGQCPSSHPYPYSNGVYCCEYLKEDYSDSLFEDSKCLGGVLTLDSTCCKNNRYVRCPFSVCEKFTLGEHVIGCWEKDDREKKGSGYRGKQSMTRSGYICQQWNEQSPHMHQYTSEEFKDRLGGNGEHNFCRNPDKRYDEVWCYTTDLVERWDWCDVPTCSDDIRMYQVEEIVSDQLVEEVPFTDQLEDTATTRWVLWHEVIDELPGTPAPPPPPAPPAPPVSFLH